MHGNEKQSRCWAWAVPASVSTAPQPELHFLVIKTAAVWAEKSRWRNKPKSDKLEEGNCAYSFPSNLVSKSNLIPWDTKKRLCLRLDCSLVSVRGDIGKIHRQSLAVELEPRVVQTAHPSL